MPETFGRAATKACLLKVGTVFVLVLQIARKKKLFNMSPIPVVTALGFHLFPFRTEKLSPIAPMVLHTRGRVGRRRLFSERVILAIV